MIQNISSNKKLLAIIIRKEFKQKGVKFFTPEDFSQQLGYMNHPLGHKIAPHIHNHMPREVQYTNEVLIIKSGKVRVDFYDDNKKYFESRILFKGDIILLVSGGHGFEMLEPTEMIEVKQGPHVGDKDKTRFKNIDVDQIIIKD
jgi:mannose-6-phosphate isomerase-like protein (cupin superfamily)